MPTYGLPSPFRRAAGRAALPAALLLAPLLLTGCASEGGAAATAEELADTPVPETVSPGTTLTIGSPEIQVALELSGLIEELSFTVEWAELSGGPECSEAFRAGALDVCSAADIPAINAHWTGLDTRLVAAEYRADPVGHPIYELGVAPGADIESLQDLRGHRIAFSPGQAQGALVLRILDAAGLTAEDVELVEIPSTGDVYPTALGNNEVDAAPLGSTNIPRYLERYGPEGGTTIQHGLRDDPAHLWVPAEAVEDPERAAAIREFVGVWARAQRWIYEHPEEWIEGYYVEDQGLSREDGEYLVEQAGEPEIPASWDEAIERHQETIDLLAAHRGEEPFEAGLLWDRRYESVAADAIEAAGDAAGEENG